MHTIVGLLRALDWRDPKYTIFHEWNARVLACIYHVGVIFRSSTILSIATNSSAFSLLDRRQMLIGMRLGMMFFICGMNGSEILLQMHTPIHGRISRAKITGIWPGMLPLYLHIAGFNVCCRGILFTTYLGIQTSFVLQVRKSGFVERSGSG